MDVSPAPKVNTSIGEAIEALIGVQFGNSSTLAACVMITMVLKWLNVEKCWYSWSILPALEDLVLDIKGNRRSLQYLRVITLLKRL